MIPITVLHETRHYKLKLQPWRVLVPSFTQIHRKNNIKIYSHLLLINMKIT